MFWGFLFHKTVAPVSDMLDVSIVNFLTIVRSTEEKNTKDNDSGIVVVYLDSDTTFKSVCYYSNKYNIEEQCYHMAFHTLTCI